MGASCSSYEDPNVSLDGLRWSIDRMQLTDPHADPSGEGYICNLHSRLSKHKHLTDVTIRNFFLDDDDAEELSDVLLRHKKLKHLDLSFNSLGAHGALAAANLLSKQLECFNLRSNDIRNQGATFISKQLLVHRTVHTLILSDNRIGNDGIAELAKALTMGVLITKLRIDGNKIGGVGALELGRGLKTNKHIQELDVSRCGIGNEGIATICGVLSDGSRLRKLWLDHNRFGATGLAFAAHSLSLNGTLEYLSVGGNLLGDEGANLLGEMLSRNVTLNTLIMSDTQLGDIGAITLARRLKENSSLRSLNLAMNTLSDAAAKALAGCLEGNKFLSSITLPRSINAHSEAYRVIVGQCHTNHMRAKRADSSSADSDAESAGKPEPGEAKEESFDEYKPGTIFTRVTPTSPTKPKAEATLMSIDNYDLLREPKSRKSLHRDPLPDVGAKPRKSGGSVAPGGDGTHIIEGGVLIDYDPKLFSIAADHPEADRRPQARLQSLPKYPVPRSISGHEDSEGRSPSYESTAVPDSRVMASDIMLRA